MSPASPPTIAWHSCTSPPARDARFTVDRKTPNSRSIQLTASHSSLPLLSLSPFFIFSFAAPVAPRSTLISAGSAAPRRGLHPPPPPYLRLPPAAPDPRRQRQRPAVPDPRPSAPDPRPPAQIRGGTAWHGSRAGRTTGQRGMAEAGDLLRLRWRRIRAPPPCAPPTPPPPDPPPRGAAAARLPGLRAPPSAGRTTGVARIRRRLYKIFYFFFFFYLRFFIFLCKYFFSLKIFS